jgi:acetamidase/formamidase
MMKTPTRQQGTARVSKRTLPAASSFVFIATATGGSVKIRELMELGTRCVVMCETGQMRILLALLIAGTLLAETRQIVADKYYRTFSHTNSVLMRIKPGDVVVTKTLDSGGQDLKGEHRSESGNPLTGPFYIESAEPGDAIAVTFRKIRLNRNWGYSGYRLGLYSITPEAVEKTYTNKYKQDLVRKGSASIVPWDIDLNRQITRLREPSSSRIKLEFPVHPMLGCAGVAAPGDFAPTSGPAGTYGGNMDYNQVAEGATLILPVYHAGALLFIGDGHALMADGEPTGTGVETSMDVEFSVDVKKNAKLDGPRLENAEYLVSIGAQPEFVSGLNRALQLATSDMVKWLTTDYQLEPWAAHQLIGAVGKYDVITVAGSMSLKVPKQYLPRR